MISLYVKGGKLGKIFVWDVAHKNSSSPDTAPPRRSYNDLTGRQADGAEGRRMGAIHCIAGADTIDVRHLRYFFHLCG